jgi:hypothetical protein
MSGYRDSAGSAKGLFESDMAGSEAEAEVVGCRAVVEVANVLNGQRRTRHHHQAT